MCLRIKRFAHLCLPPPRPPLLPLAFPLTDQTAIALSNPSGLWKHTPRYISFEEITGSLMKYADNKKRKKGLRLG